MNYIRKIFPPFFLKIDYFLLINYPHIWATYLHYLVAWVVFYGVIFGSMMIFYPISSDNIPNIQNLHHISLVPNVIAFLFWVYKLSQFEVKKNFGFISKSKQIFTHLAYIFCIFLLAYSPRFYLKSLFYRVENVVSKEKLIADYHYISNFSKLMRMYRLSDDSLHYINPEKIAYLHTTAFLCYKHNNSQFMEAQEKIQSIDNEELIKRGLIAFNEYSPQKMDISAAEISEKVKNKEYKSIRLPFNALHYKLSANFDIIAQAQYEKSLLELEIGLGYLRCIDLILLGINLCLIWFLGTKKQTFLFAIFISVAIGIAYFPAIQIILGDNWTEVKRNILYVRLFWTYLAILALFLFLAYRKFKARLILFPQTMLLMANVTICCLPFLFVDTVVRYNYPSYFAYWEIINEDKKYLSYFSLLLAYSFWLFIFEKKSRNLNSEPL